MKKEFQIEVVCEGLLGSIFLGASKLPVKRMQEVMNSYGRDGWDVSFIVVEKKRLLLFWVREAAIITFSRPCE